MMEICTGRDTTGLSSVEFELFKVNSTTSTIAKIVFTRACSKTGVEALKWQTPAIWEELYSKMEEVGLEFMEKKIPPMEIRKARTENLCVSFKFIPIADYHKTLFTLDAELDSKENLHSNTTILDYILLVSATLKREHKNSQCNCILSSTHMKQQHQLETNEVTPKKNVLAPRNTEKSSEKVQPKETKNVGTAKSAGNKVFGTCTSKSNTTSTVTSRSRLAQSKKSGLSLRSKNTIDKTQSDITKFLIKTPPFDKFSSKLVNSQKSTANTLQDLSSLKRKAVKENDETKSSKIVKKVTAKENVKSTPEKTSTLRISRSKIKEMKEKISEVSIKEEEVRMETDAEDLPELVMKTEKCNDSLNARVVTPDKKLTRIKLEDGNKALAGCSETKDEVKCEDLDVLAKQMEECIPLIRSPVKVSTPRRTRGRTENQDLSAYDISVDDPRYSQYLQDCDELKKVFVTGEVDLVSVELAQRMYELHLPYVEAVHTKKVFSRIYNKFSKDKDEGYKMEYTEGCIIFSRDNVTLFAQNIGAHFSKNGDDNIKKLNYYLKVLVPELIIKIVMGVYKINKQEAMDKMVEVGYLVTERYEHLFF